MRTVDRVAIDVAANELALLFPCLDRVMAWFAQALPVVVTIPEQHLVTLVRGDVVDHCGWGDLPLLLAVPAQGMLRQKGYSGLAPLVVVASLVRSSSIFHAAT